jgi:hypothetical protein
MLCWSSLKRDVSKTGTTLSGLTPIAARLSLALDDEYLRMQNEWFFKWHFIGRDGPVEIDGFDGRKIKYGGIKFSGSAHLIYWQTIQRYLRKKIGAIFDEIEADLPRYPREVRERTLSQIHSMVLQFAGKIRKAAVDKDQILRGNGIEFPPAHDFGQWEGCGHADIEGRIATLSEIYCDRNITIEGTEMSLNALKAMMTEKLVLVKEDGTVNRENISGRVTDNLVLTLVKDLPIEPGDHFLRKLPSGLVDDFIVVDPGYTGAVGPIPAHFQARVRRSGAAAAAQQAVIQSITNNFHGANARVNINSTDNSVNIATKITTDQVAAFLDQLRPLLPALPASTKEEMAAPLAQLEDEIRAPAPSQSRILGGLHSLKTIAESATGNLVAAGIVALVVQLLTSG